MTINPSEWRDLPPHERIAALGDLSPRDRSRLRGEVVDSWKEFCAEDAAEALIDGFPNLTPEEQAALGDLTNKWDDAIRTGGGSLITIAVMEGATHVPPKVFATVLRHGNQKYGEDVRALTPYLANNPAAISEPALAPMVESAVRIALGSNHKALADFLKNIPPQHHPSFDTEDLATMMKSEEAYLRQQAIALAGRNLGGRSQGAQGPTQGPTPPGPPPPPAPQPRVRRI